MQKKGYDDPLTRLSGKCRQYKLRVTPQRIAIYRELLKSKLHPSAEMIYRGIRKLFPNISFDTVNRTLLTFAEIGLVDVVEGYGSPRRYDPNVKPHHHMCCIRCSTIIDFNSDDYDNLDLPLEIPEGFVVLGRRVVLKGICRKCS
jgi:Fur family peroxide stress response transcriptional regulator